MRQTQSFWPLSKFLGAVCLGVVASFSFFIYEKSGPSVIVQSITTIDDTVRAQPEGDTISFLIRTETVKECPSVVSRYVWHVVTLPDGEKVHNYYSIDNPPLGPEPGLGKHSYIITLKVQAGLGAQDVGKPETPDQWYERTNSLPQCGFFSWLDFNKPTVTDHPIKKE